MDKDTNMGKTATTITFVILTATIIFVFFLPIQNYMLIKHVSDNAITIQQVKSEVKQQIDSTPKPKDGYTPVKNIDYFDGAKGDKGDKGDSVTGATGAQGLSAYQVAVNAGFVGTEQDWLDSLHSPVVMPEFRCNPVKLRLEYRLGTSGAWSIYIYNGAIIPCLGL